MCINKVFIETWSVYLHRCEIVWFKGNPNINQKIRKSICPLDLKFLYCSLLSFKFFWSSCQQPHPQLLFGWQRGTVHQPRALVVKVILHLRALCEEGLTVCPSSSFPLCRKVYHSWRQKNNHLRSQWFIYLFIYWYSRQRESSLPTSVLSGKRWLPTTIRARSICFPIANHCIRMPHFKSGE